MSWKLAELRWRHEVGMRESAAGKGKGPTHEDKIVRAHYSHDGRPTTGPASHPIAGRLRRSEEISLRQNSSILFHALGAHVMPDLDPWDFDSYLSVSSATPLLKLPRCSSSASLGNVRTARLDHTRKFSFQHETAPFTTDLSSLTSPGPSSTDLYPHSLTPSGILACADSEPQLGLPSVLIAEAEAEPPSQSLSALDMDDGLASTGAQPPVVGCGLRMRSSTHDGLESPSDSSISHFVLTPDDELPPVPPMKNSIRDRGMNTRIPRDGSDRRASEGYRKVMLTPTLKPEPQTLSFLSESEYIALPVRSCPSLETTHHSDSYLLERGMVDHEKSSCRWRKPVLCQLPDLQTRDTDRPADDNTSDNPDSSPERETRFPLALSASSDEGEELERLATMSIQHDSTPLHRLRRHQVRSAHGVLREAEHHQESSAVFEAPDSSIDQTTSLAESQTLDDILSQYADHVPDSSEYHRALRGIENMLTHSDCRSWTSDESRSQVGQSAAVTSRPRPISLGLPVENNFTQASPITQVPSVDPLADSNSNKVSSESPPQSSRCGFLTPSKMRFRLAKRDSPENMNSSGTLRKSPTSPWDPIGQLNAERHIARICRAEDLDHIQKHSLASRGALDVRSLMSDQTQKELRNPLDGHQAFRRMRLPKLPKSPALAQLQHFSHNRLRPRPPSAVVPLRDSFLGSSSSYAQENFALPSSSLLHDLTMRSKFATPATIDSRGTSLSKIEENLLFNSSLLEQQQFTSPYPDMQIHGFQSTHSRRHAQSQLLVATRDKANPQHQTTDVPSKEPTRSQFNSAQHSIQSFLAKRLLEGRYSNSDGDISLFLRNNPVINESSSYTGKSQGTNVQAACLGGKATGSSLADYSSGATPVTNNKQDTALPTSVAPNVMVSRDISLEGNVNLRPSLQLSWLTRGNVSSSFGLNKMDSGQMTLVSSDSTSASLLSRHPPAKSGARDSMLDEYHCPMFPLTQDQLIFKPPVNTKPPFERIHMMSNGEWLERAWCFVHRRSEFSHARMTTKKSQARGNELLDHQRQTGRLLLTLGVVTYFIGGFVLVHDMVEQGALSQMAMEALMPLVSRQADRCATGSQVLASEARMARAVQRTGIAIVVLVLVACFGVCVWAAVTSE